jgi:hypothetical protein
MPFIGTRINRELEKGKNYKKEGSTNRRRDEGKGRTEV